VRIRIENITADAKELEFAETADEINRILGQGPIREYQVEGPIEVAVSFYRAGMEALGAAEEKESLANESETHRLTGDLLLKQSSNAAEAQSCFQRAIEIARKQSAKSWELRATTSLARLLAKQGCRDEARTMLAHIYGWFTEGFDTADLKDAKVLLDQLSA